MLFKQKTPTYSKDLLIHVGMPKTGSTAIQNFLANNSKRLETAGYVLPKLSKKKFLGHDSGNGVGALKAIIKQPSFLEEEERHILASSENLFWKLADPGYVADLLSTFNFRNVKIVALVAPVDRWMSRWISHLVSYHGIGKSEIERNVADTLENVESAFKHLRQLANHADVELRLIPYQYGITDSIESVCQEFNLTELELKPVPANTFSNRSAHSLIIDAISKLELASHLSSEDEANLKRLVNAMSEVLRGRDIPEPHGYLLSEASLNRIREVSSSIRRILGRKLCRPIKKTFSTLENISATPYSDGYVDHLKQNQAVLEILHLIKKGSEPVVFNEEEYLRLNPDVDMDPLEHYLTYGINEGRRIR